MPVVPTLQRRSPASLPISISTSRQGVARVQSYENEGSITSHITYICTRLLCARAKRASGQSRAGRGLFRRQHGGGTRCSFAPHRGCAHTGGLVSFTVK